MFIFRFPRLFTFHKHKQRFVYILKKTIKVQQHGYPVKIQVTWHGTGQAGTGRAGTGQAGPG
jgi:hypothetical protein